MQRAEATGKANGQQINGDNGSLERQYEEIVLACRRPQKGIPHRKGQENAESRGLSRGQYKVDRQGQARPRRVDKEEETCLQASRIAKDMQGPERQGVMQEK